MLQQEEKMELAQLESDNLIETKYQRVGHINEGRLCDALVNYCVKRLPGDALPSRWKYTSVDKFVATFGNEAKWAVTKSYHCYMFKGQYVFRIWTNAGQKFACIDLPEHIAASLKMFCTIEPIHIGSLHKCRPMTHRFKAKTTQDMDLLIDLVKQLYGV
jgi:hypothetical protein